MKTKKMNYLLVAALLISTSLATYGQRGEDRMMQRNYRQNNFEQNDFQHRRMNRLNLTDEQNEKIDALRTAHLKEINTLRNEISIKKAELNALEEADNANMKSINTKIDEISVLRTKLHKTSAAHRQEVRAQLTDEQKVIYDSFKRRGENRNSKGRYSQRSNRHAKRGF